MTVLKIKGGTPAGAESRCDTCWWAHIQYGYKESEKLVFCTYGLFRKVPFAVAECSDYGDRRIPSRRDMEEIAWILRSSKAGKTAGFVSAEEAAKDEEEVLAE